MEDELRSYAAAIGSARKNLTRVAVTVRTGSCGSAWRKTSATMSPHDLGAATHAARVALTCRRASDRPQPFERPTRAGFGKKSVFSGHMTVEV